MKLTDVLTVQSLRKCRKFTFRERAPRKGAGKAGGVLGQERGEEHKNPQ